MFWTFIGDKNKLNENGDTFKIALMKHILWCCKTVLDKNSDETMLWNAFAELRDHIIYDKTFVKWLEEDGVNWEKYVKDFFEKLYGKSINEIFPPREDIPFSELNHRWGHMPYTKDEYKADKFKEDKKNC